MKPKETSTTIEGNTETIDWRNIPVLKRIEIAIAIIFRGRVKITWKSQKVNLIRSDSK